MSPTTGPPENFKTQPERMLFRRPIMIAIVILAIVGGVSTFYAWDYRPQTLVNDTVSIKESQLWTMSVDLLFGDRTTQLSVETYQIPVFVTFWWQSGTNAFVLLQSQPVAVNSTWATTVTLHNSGGQYNVLVSKSETHGEGLTNIHVKVTI
jgi:hypothetical protein